MSTAERHLVRSLRELGELDVAQHSLPEILRRLAVLANDIVPASTFVGVTLDVRGEASTAAFTDDVVPEIDEVQNKTGAGPCVEAARQGVIFEIPSTRKDERWRLFSEACVHHGVLSTLSVPVVSASKKGALNFYASQEDAFGDYDVEVAEAFAVQACVAIQNSESYWSVRQLADQLSTALSTRVVIELAKGCLIAGGRTGDEAFDLLRSVSQRTNRKLHDVAADLVAAAEARARETRAHTRPVQATQGQEDSPTGHIEPRDHGGSKANQDTEPR